MLALFVDASDGVLRSPAPSRPLNSSLNSSLSDSSRSSSSPGSPALGLRMFFFIALSIAALVIDGRSEKLRGVRYWTNWALTPVVWVGDLPRMISTSFEHLRGRESLLAENRELRAKELEQEARLLQLASLEAENQRIRELLASSTQLKDRVVIAEVVAASQDPYRHQIVLNKGARDEVYRGQAVLDATGVMGQVIQVNPSSCIVLLITDPNHGIPVEINRTGLQTIALGRGDGQGLSMPYLPANSDVKVGDLLISSGLGGRFPAGYPVGRIRELKHSGGENFMEAVALPSARLHQGRQALLVWSEHSSQLEKIPEVPIALPSEGGARTPAAVKPSKKAAAAEAKAAAPAATAPPAPAPAGAPQ